MKLTKTLGKIAEPVLKILSKFLGYFGDLLRWISESMWVVPVFITIMLLGRL